MKSKYLPLLDLECYDGWQLKARKEINDIIKYFNDWQLECCCLCEHESKPNLPKLKRLIEFGKQTISTDSIIAHDTLSEMENHIKDFERYQNIGREESFER